MTEAETHSLDVPGAVLAYDVRRNGASTEPVLFLVGAPMGASGFATLAGHFDDRTVVTYDPRGVDRSRRADGGTAGTPDEHADDLHRLVSELNAGPADFFGSSGGAVNGLALVTHHPGDVRVLVAHEPPAAQVLPDRRQALAAAADIHDTYMRGGFGQAMAKFLAFVSLEGPIPFDYARRPAPDPSAFGLPTDDDGSRNDPLLGRHMLCVTHYRIDFDALRSASTRIVLGVGAESGAMMPGRAAIAIAEQLGTRPVTFPGGHGGFFSADQTEVSAFTATLRRILSGEG